MMEEQAARLSTGVAGLDEVLLGGVIPRRSYLVQGRPGTGKTTLGLHFLTAKQTSHEPVLFISLIKRPDDVRHNATQLGFDISDITFLDLSPTPEVLTEEQPPRIFSPAEMERAPLTRQIAEQIQSRRPVRIFIDALTQLRYFATDEYDYRRLTLSVLRFCLDQQATVFASSESDSVDTEHSLEFLVDGLFTLDMEEDRRSVTVSKYLGSDFLAGRHSMRLTDTGMVVFPRLVEPELKPEFTGESISSGNTELDALLGGGIERGLVTIISGPSGIGKTLLCLSFIHQAAQRGESSVIYIYEETSQPLILRAENVGIPLRDFIERNLVKVVTVQPDRYLPDEFTALVREEVEQRNARVVMIDNISGYRLTLRDRDLVRSLHILCDYLKSHDVTTLIVNNVEEITGDFRITEIGISFMADNVVFMRYLEFGGQLRKAVGVLKKRMGDFEKTLRQLEITKEGLIIGKPLTNLRGILRGTPTWVGPEEGG